MLYVGLLRHPVPRFLFFVFACRLQWSTAADSSAGEGCASLLMELIVPSNQGGGLAAGVALVIEVGFLEDGPLVRGTRKRSMVLYIYLGCCCLCRLGGTLLVQLDSSTREKNVYCTAALYITVGVAFVGDLL